MNKANLKAKARPVKIKKNMGHPHRDVSYLDLLKEIEERVIPLSKKSLAKK